MHCCNDSLCYGMNYKVCTKCRELKHLGDYYQVTRKGLKRPLARCKACVSQYLKVDRLKPERKAAVREAYLTRVAGGWKNKPWADKTPEQRQASYQGLKRWRAKNREAFNREQRLSLQLRRSKAFQVAWPVILEHYGKACLCCGQTNPLCFDHVQPLADKGDNLLSNGQPLCRGCNAGKGQMPVRNTDHRPDKGAWIRELVALNPWLGEAMPAGRWHLSGEGRGRVSRIAMAAMIPLFLPPRALAH